MDGYYWFDGYFGENLMHPYAWTPTRSWPHVPLSSTSSWLGDLTYGASMPPISVSEPPSSPFRTNPTAEELLDRTLEKANDEDILAILKAQFANLWWLDDVFCCGNDSTDDKTSGGQTCADNAFNEGHPRMTSQHAASFPTALDARAGSCLPSCDADAYAASQSDWPTVHPGYGISTANISYTSVECEQYEERKRMPIPRKTPASGRRTQRQHRGRTIRKQTSRRPTAETTAAAGSGRRSKGVTMLYRTMARKLLAGSGWIMDSSISKEDAKLLIKTLMGQDLTSLLNVDTVLDEIEDTTPSKKEDSCDALLAELMSCYTGQEISARKANSYIQRLKGPYRIVDDFEKLLAGKRWPPNQPEERELRSFNCYREGECLKDVQIA